MLMEKSWDGPTVLLAPAHRVLTTSAEQVREVPPHLPGCRSSLSKEALPLAFVANRIVQGMYTCKG